LSLGLLLVMIDEESRVQHIEEAVQRYLQGEDVNSLARQYGMSRAGMYLWIKKAKQAATANMRLHDLGPKGIAREKRISVELENKALKAENEQLRQNCSR